MKFAIKIFVASLLVVGTNQLLSQHYLQSAVSRSAMLRLDEAAHAYPRPVTTVFVGDSHMGRAIDPREFGREAFSLWSPGQCFIRSHYRLQDFMDASDHAVERVILSVSLHSFREARVRRITILPWLKYIPFGEVNAAFDLPADFAWTRARAALFPYAGHFEDHFLMREEDVSVEDVIDAQGALPHKPVPAPSEWTQDMALARLALQFESGPEALSEGYAAYLARTVALARTRGASVYLVTTPVTKAYWEEARLLVALEEFYAIIGAQSGATHLDYHDLYFDRPELFRDPDHLNEAGSIEFAKLLKEDMEAIAARQSAE